MDGGPHNINILQQQQQQQQPTTTTLEMLSRTLSMFTLMFAVLLPLSFVLLALGIISLPMKIIDSPKANDLRSVMCQNQEREVGASNVIQARGRESQPVIPDDGYEWKKYGRKFVNAIGKIRSYYRCRRANCIAKKTVEWPPKNPSDVQIKYSARHSHSPMDESNSSWQQEEAARRNAYNLYNQVFGPPQVFEPQQQRNSS